MLSKLRVKAGGALISSVLNTTMRSMKLHPKTWAVRKGIRVHSDIDYLDQAGPKQRLDIYQPEGAETKLPVFLYIHGGGFRILSKKTHWMINYKFAQRGFVVFSIDYRLVPDGEYPAALQDVMAAVKWIMKNGDAYGADTSQWFIGGESAGANLALSLAIAACDKRPEPWAADIYDMKLPIKALFPACGMLQVSDCFRFKTRKPKLPTLLADRISSVCQEYLGNDTNAGSLADPLVILESDWTPERPFPPTMSLVGTKDPIIDDTRRLGRALTERGVPNTIKIYPGGIHGFHVVFWSERGQQAWADQFEFLDAYYPHESTGDPL
tara:strand:- start:57 stop:1028 length:972 start_codon:yes stop_codon:yes gene_type:complete